VLPRGRQRMRASARVGDQIVTSRAVGRSFASGARAVTAVAPGAYHGTAGPGTRSARFRVSGRTLLGFSAQVPMLCPGVTPGQFTIQIGNAAISRIRIAPDGSFVGVASPSRHGAGSGGAASPGTAPRRPLAGGPLRSARAVDLPPLG
jgi:hypothetical protein